LIYISSNSFWEIYFDPSNHVIHILFIFHHYRSQFSWHNCKWLIYFSYWIFYQVKSAILIKSSYMTQNRDSANLIFLNSKYLLIVLNSLNSETSIILSSPDLLIFPQTFQMILIQKNLIISRSLPKTSTFSTVSEFFINLMQTFVLDLVSGLYCLLLAPFELIVPSTY
jgi:hypothetical protein